MVNFLADGCASSAAPQTGRWHRYSSLLEARVHLCSPTGSERAKLANPPWNFHGRNARDGGYEIPGCASSALGLEGWGTENLSGVARRLRGYLLRYPRRCKRAHRGI